jgi:two-component system sensor histidine kinase CiaH
MIPLKPPKLAPVIVVYWFLLVYMIAALGWWYIALEKQNTAISNIRLNELKKDNPAYYSQANTIIETSNRKSAQYIGEGLTFLALILTGAVFVYRAARKQFRFSEQQQNFMMAITHELKTPIAIAQLNLQTLQKRKLDSDKQAKLIANTLYEANRLNILCNNILFASQLDAGGYAAVTQKINMTDLLENGVDDCKIRFADRIFTEQIQEDAFLQGDSFLLQMLVNNLLENAVKYAPKEEAINVTLSVANGTIKLSVADKGAGITDLEKKKIFDKFYRSGNENIRKAQGTGLGLYLCKKIVDAHNGNITVTDNQPNGSIFAVIFNYDDR